MNLFNSFYELHKSIIGGLFYNKSSSIAENITYFMYKYSTTAMQCMHDICYNYGLDNDVLFNPLKSVCMLFKPKGYKLYRQNIIIGTEV